MELLLYESLSIRQRGFFLSYKITVIEFSVSNLKCFYAKSVYPSQYHIIFDILRTPKNLKTKMIFTQPLGRFFLDSDFFQIDFFHNPDYQEFNFY